MSLSGLLTVVDLETGAELYHVSSPLSVAIGNFDGVHLGHRKLLLTAVEYAEKLRSCGENADSAVFLFSPSPADLLMASPPPHICSIDRKLKIFSEMGVRYALVGDSRKLKDFSAEDFCRILKDRRRLLPPEFQRLQAP